MIGPVGRIGRTERTPPVAGGGLPFAFVENRGQWGTAARFVATVGTTTAHCEPGAITLQRAHHRVRFTFEGASAEAPIEGESPLPGVWNFFLGSDPSRWRSGVRGFASVLYRGLRPGVDLRLRKEGGRLEYDLLLAPGVSPEGVVVRCEGSDGLRVTSDGALVLDTPVGPLRQEPPATFAVSASGARTPIPCRFVAVDRARFRFAVGPVEPDSAILIDPGIHWGTFLGGRDWESVKGVAVDAAGHVTVAGSTNSPDFPTTAGAFDRTYNGHNTAPWPVGDLFVARFHRDTGALAWATFLGGSHNDQGSTLEVDAAGNAYVSGWTSSTDFPTTPGAFDRTFNGEGLGNIYGGGDLFVTKLNPTGTALVYSTYIGGDDLEYVLSTAVDASGAITLSGHVHSTNFPITPGAYSATMNGFSDAFVTRLDPTGSSLVFSTYFGGGVGEEYPMGLAVDASGATTIAGPTDSPDLPVTPDAFDPTYNGGAAHFAEGFVTKLDATGSRLIFSTFLGGTGDETIYGLSQEPGGATTVVGETNSADFPTTPGAYDRSHNGNFDGFVTRLDPTGSFLLWSTFLGGSAADKVEEIVTDGAGGAFVCGSTESADLPVTRGAFDTSPNGGLDAFVASLDPAGSRLRYSTLLGGPAWDNALELAIDATGSVAVGGDTGSATFPTTPGAWSTTINPGGSAFVVRLDLLPTGVSRFGAGTPGCSGPPVVGVGSMPEVANQSFSLTCAKVAPKTTGFLVLSVARLTTPLVFLGASIWVDPATMLLVVPAGADDFGSAEATLPVPADPGLRGARLYGQFLWPDACAAGGLAASNAAEVVIQ